MKLKPFGDGGQAISRGDLARHVGWIEALANDEEENFSNSRGLKYTRWCKVQDASQLLNEALEA